MAGTACQRRQFGSSPAADFEELWRRIAFSILINHGNGPLHNHGFLHVSRGQWRLAPAFDLNPFPDRVQELKTWISEETGHGYFRISRERVRGVLAETEAAVAGWRREGREIGMTSAELSGFEAALELQLKNSARFHPRAAELR